MTQYFLRDTAFEGVMVPSNKKQTVPLKVANLDQPIALADLAELFKYNVWRKIAKHLGLEATGKLQDIVDRVVAAWLERGDLVQFVPPPPKKKMQVEDWIAYFKEYFAQYDEDGNVLPLHIPAEHKKAVFGRDRINQKKNDRSLTDHQIEALESVGFVFTGNRADKWEKNLVAFQEHKEVHGHLVITPSTAARWPGLYEKVRAFREDWRAIQCGKKGTRMNVDRIAQLEALGFDFNPTRMTFDTSGGATSSACGKGVESIPSDDANDPPASPVPSGGTNDPVVPRKTIVADRLPIVADFLAKSGKSGLDWFQMDPKGATKFIHGDEASPVLLLQTANLLRQGHPGIEFLVSSPNPRPREAAMILLEGALLHDTTVACAEAVLSIPGIQDFVSADPSNASLLFLGTDPASDLVEKVSDYLSNDLFQALLHLSTSSAASKLDKLIVTHATQVPSGGREVAVSSSVKPSKPSPSSPSDQPSFASASEPSKPPPSPSDQSASKREVYELAAYRDKVAEEDEERQRQFRQEDEERQRQYRQTDQEHQRWMASMLNRTSKLAENVSGGIVPCSNDASYRNAPGSISPDGRCGLRSILQYLFELLGMEQFLVLLYRQGISLPPDVDFAWGESRALRVWLDELWQECFFKYLRLIRKDDNEFSLSKISAGDIERRQSGGLVYTGECERIRENIFKNTRTIGNPSSDRLMDERIGYAIGSILDVNIYAIQQGQDPQPFYGVATSGITVTLNFDARHFDIQGHQSRRDRGNLPQSLRHHCYQSRLVALSGSDMTPQDYEDYQYVHHRSVDDLLEFDTYATSIESHQPTDLMVDDDEDASTNIDRMAAEAYFADILSEVLDLYQDDPREAAKLLLDVEEFPAGIAKMVNLLGQPCVRALITSHPYEAALMLLIGYCGLNTTEVVTTVFSFPCIQDFVCADPSSAALLCLSTETHPALVQKVSALLASKRFLSVLRRDAGVAGASLVKFISSRELSPSSPSSLPSNKSENEDEELLRRYEEACLKEKKDRRKAMEEGRRFGGSPNEIGGRRPWPGLSKPYLLGWLKSNPYAAAKDLLGAEASSILVAKMADLLGRPCVRALVDFCPTTAAFVLLEGAFLQDHVVAIAEAMFSIAGIEDFLSADPSTAALLFLGADPPRLLVEAVSRLFAVKSFHLLIIRSAVAAAAHLDKVVSARVVGFRPKPPSGTLPNKRTIYDE